MFVNVSLAMFLKYFLRFRPYLSLIILKLALPKKKRVDSKNGWLLVSAIFTAKFGLVFVLILENAFS